MSHRMVRRLHVDVRRELPRHGYAQLGSRKVIKVEGPDAVRFLQGLTTNQMNRIAQGGEGVQTAFLNAQGRVMMDAFVYPSNTSQQQEAVFYVDCDASDQLVDHLCRYKLRLKVDVNTDEWRVWQAWGPTALSLWGYTALPKGVPVGSMVARPFARIGCRDPRHPQLGIRFLLNASETPKLPEAFVASTEDEFKLVRILNGIPEGSQDFFASHSLPLESNLDLTGGIDFRKGCYLGQELTIRTYHTGVTRKRIVPVQFYRPDEPLTNCLTLDRTFDHVLPQSQSRIDNNEANTSMGLRPIGKFCSGIFNVGLALVRLEHVFDASNEHVLVGANGLRLRAFAPDWFPTTKT